MVDAVEAHLANSVVVITAEPVEVVKEEVLSSSMKESLKRKSKKLGSNETADVVLSSIGSDSLSESQETTTGDRDNHESKDS
jgi:hypothetical protein